MYVWLDALSDYITVLGYPDYVFANNHLTSIIIPNSVTTIGQVAFSNNDLTSVTIPSSVTSLGSGSFAFNNLMSATILGTPTGLTNPSSSVFAGNDVDLETAMALSTSGTFGADPRSLYMNSTATIVPVYMPNGAGSSVSGVGSMFNISMYNRGGMVSSIRTLGRSTH